MQFFCPFYLGSFYSLHSYGISYFLLPGDRRLTPLSSALVLRSCGCGIEYCHQEWLTQRMPIQRKVQSGSLDHRTCVRAIAANICVAADLW
jgi:hypothetical protein